MQILIAKECFNKIKDFCNKTISACQISYGQLHNVHNWYIWIKFLWQEISACKEMCIEHKSFDICFIVTILLQFSWLMSVIDWDVNSKKKKKNNNKLTLWIHSQGFQKTYYNVFYFHYSPFKYNSHRWIPGGMLSSNKCVAVK